MSVPLERNKANVMAFLQVVPETSANDNTMF